MSSDNSYKVTPNMTRYAYDHVMNESGVALFGFCLGDTGIATISLDNVTIGKR